MKPTNVFIMEEKKHKGNVSKQNSELMCCCDKNKYDTFSMEMPHRYFENEQKSKVGRHH